jgi:hypothetical protein
MNVTTPNVDTIIQGDCLEEMKKLPDISRNSRREQAKIFCVEEILPDALDEIERLRASLIDLHAEYINTLEKNPECSAWDLDEQSDADQRRLRKNAMKAISISEPPVYLLVEEQAAQIKELEADLEQSEICIQARLDVIDQQAAYIKELESSLDEAEALTKQNAELMNGYLRRIAELEDALVEERSGAIRCEFYDHCEIDLPDAMIRARQELQADGKIGPDAKPRVWQITEERKAAIDRGLQFLEWSYAKNSAHDTKEQIAVLWAMLDEDTHGKP